MDLEKYENKINKETDKRAKELEKQLKKDYQDILKKINNEISVIFQKYEREGILTHSEMVKYDRLRKFKAEIIKYIDDIYKTVYKAISKGLEVEYAETYKYMAYSLEMVSKTIIKYDRLTEETIKAAVNNPINGLTLSDNLNVNRATIIRDINKTISQGLMKGTTYGTMSKGIKTVLNDDYKKAVRIVRTEAHRVNEQGKNESALVAHNQGIRQTKTWRSMKDERVRDMHADMDGVTVPLDQDFKLPDGYRGPYPGSIGVAKHDISCRCLTVRKISNIEKKTDENNIMFTETYSEWQKNKKI